jgi:outer membrane protein assembly factor BamE (lipoprotein component of BamABCDE complex)
LSASNHIRLACTLALTAVALGCNRISDGAAPGADVSILRIGMSADEVRKQLGEPSPGGSVNNTATGQTQERWIYGAGDDALFIILANGQVQSFEKKRCTMKDAAAKLKPGMSPAQVVAILGPPDDDSNYGGGKRAQSFSNKDAAIDSLRVEYESDAVARTIVIPNAALNSQGSDAR